MSNKLEVFIISIGPRTMKIRTDVASLFLESNIVPYYSTYHEPHMLEQIRFCKEHRPNIKWGVLVEEATEDRDFVGVINLDTLYLLLVYKKDLVNVVSSLYEEFGL